MSTRWRASIPGRRGGLVYGAGVEDAGEQKQIAAIVGRLYEAFVACDAMLCEINPLIVTRRARCAPRFQVHRR